MGLMQDNEARHDRGYVLPVRPARRFTEPEVAPEYPPNYFGPANFWTDPNGLYDTAGMFVLPFIIVWVLTFVLLFTSHSVPALKLPLTIAIVVVTAGCLTWRWVGKYRNSKMIRAKEAESAAAEENNRLF